jgi:aspartate kinase
MKIFKFGGASTANAEGMKNVANIIKDRIDNQLVVIVSAMGKTTNTLETLLKTIRSGEDFMSHYNKVKDYHLEIMHELFPTNHPVFSEVEVLFFMMMTTSKYKNEDYDFHYDQLVSIGEMLSSKIVASYLNFIGVDAKWLDVRKCISTDSNFREGNVNWVKTSLQISEVIDCEANSKKCIVTQGFLGGDEKGRSITLGREGSDYTGAIFAHCLEADSLTIWKDVPGFLNADPRYFSETTKIPQIAYSEAIELAYYGADVIHPKTIKPLQNKNIPLLVKSFKDPNSEGTVIHTEGGNNKNITFYICKPNQVLFTIYPKDFSFIAEQNLSYIFFVFAENNMKINLMQNSALSFTVCVSNNSQRIDDVIEQLSNKFDVRHNADLQLITLRHFKESDIKNLTKNIDILLEQRTRSTAQLVVKGFC